MVDMNMIKSLNSALSISLKEDPNVVIFGEDVGFFGGVFRVTEGLQDEYGAHRVFDSPLAEGGIAAIAMGMGLNGLRPVAEIQFADYIFPAYDQIVNEIAKVRHRSGGEFTAPLTFRTPAGGGIKGGHHHSQSPEAQFTHTPGLKVVYCSNPYNAKGLLLSSIECNDPVIFFEPKRVTEARSMETRITSQHGQAIQMLMSLKDITPFLLNKHESSRKVMLAQSSLMEQWSTLQNRRLKIQESTVNLLTYRRLFHGTEILLSIQSRKQDDVSSSMKLPKPAGSEQK